MSNSHSVIQSDQAITHHGEDKFQRVEFAQGISNLIHLWSKPDSLVIGLYGSWGEGKSSILNLVDEQLVPHTQIISARFNPWIYDSESELLTSFFETIANTLDRSFGGFGVQARKSIKQYKQLLNLGSEALGLGVQMGQWFADLFKLLPHAQEDIEQVKKQIGNYIEASGKKLVIFIDDIDRLDNNEVYSMLRLVKLTANFTNTVYVLSLDHERVSQAIGQRFGNSNTQAGQDYLDKIIQIPVRLPKLHSSALTQYLEHHLRDVLHGLNITLDNNVIQSILTTIEGCFETPRQVIRYCNSLTFSLALLEKKVYIPDLIMLETVRIIYPQFYEYIRSNPQFFTRRINKNAHPQKHTREQAIDTYLTDNNFTETCKVIIWKILQKLSPTIQQDYIIPDTRIGRFDDPDYFNSFFSYVYSNESLLSD